MTTKTKFAVITDTHYNIPGSTPDSLWWNKFLLSRIEEISDALVSTIRRLSPDFLVHCGDFTNDSKIEHFRYGLDVMDACRCPYFIVFGNHDGYLPNTRGTVARMLGLENDVLYYSSEINGMRFYFLDSAFWITNELEAHDYLDWEKYKQKGYRGTGPLHEEIEWLRNKLGRHDEDPSFLVTHIPFHSKAHYPVGRMPKGEPVPETPLPAHRIASYCLHHEALREITQSFRHLRMVFAGHWHIHDLVSDNGVYHCQTGSLIEYPFQMRVMEYDGSTLTSSVVPLDGLDLASESFVAEWGNTWVNGNPEDRDFSLKLR